MTNDRPVNLDFGTPRPSGFEAPPSGSFEARPGNGDSARPGAGRQDQQDQQLQKDTSKLRELLKTDEPSPLQSRREPAPQDDQPDGRHAALNPFDLFGSASSVSQEPEVAVQAPEISGLEDNLARMARSLMVGESPRGGEAVRMELTAENLPGVVLEVFRDQGAIVAQFVCANEHSRTQLARAASWLGESLSHRLSHDTLVRVLTDDPEDPSPVEARNQGDRN